jgi:hypothetical protein
VPRRANSLVRLVRGTIRPCGEAYRFFCAGLGALTFQHFVGEFDVLRGLYREYKRAAALLDFDDLLHHACDLIKTSEAMCRALARRYPRILVDEFQDTDPLQAQILWRIAGDRKIDSVWHDNIVRPGALFHVADIVSRSIGYYPVWDNDRKRCRPVRYGNVGRTRTLKPKADQTRKRMRYRSSRCIS